MIVMDAVSKKVIEDTLVDIKFSGISWKGNEGFFYSSYDRPEKSELSDKTDQQNFIITNWEQNKKMIKLFLVKRKMRNTDTWVLCYRGWQIFNNRGFKIYQREYKFLKSLGSDNSPLIPIDEDYSTIATLFTVKKIDYFCYK